MKKVSLFLFASLLLFSACDVLDDPVVPFTVGYQDDLYGQPPTFEPPTNTQRNVLLEDFTAHQCGNCPDAGVIAEDILENHPGRVALVAIHAGNLAAFNEEPPYDTDWTTPEGNFYWDQLAFQANPLGRINRQGGPENFFSPSEWAAITLPYLEEEATMALQMVLNPAPENGHLNIHVHGTLTSSLANSTNLVLLITESELYDYQLWYEQEPSTTIPDYHFKHTLRGSVTGPQGLQFSPPESAAGATFQKDYTFEWNDLWVMENCHVVAIISDNETGEILNCIEAQP